MSLEFFASNGASSSSKSELDETTVLISHEGRTERFMVCQDNSLFRSLVLNEFLIPLQSQIGLYTFHGDGKLMLPFEVGLMKNNAEYEMKVYSPQHVVPLPPKQAMPSAVEPAATGDDTNGSMKTDEENETVVAAFDYVPNSNSELKICEGDVIQVTQKYNNLWWMGIKNGQKGFFPTNYVKLPGSQQLLSDTLGSGGNMDQEEYDLQDDEYFEGYANLQIHWEMLRDTSRTLAYKKGISDLAAHIKGKVVLDIGCGSGVLSIFCAQMGAKHVYAVDASEIIEHAKSVVALNNLGDRITLISGKIESISLPVDQVDVIVSEWMGTMLICESMIASVLTARIRYLRQGGLMIPGESTLFLCPLSCPDYYEEKVDFWDNVYDINMGCLKGIAHKEFFDRPVFSRVIPEAEMIATPAEIFVMDMHTAVEDDLENILSHFKFEVTKSGKFHGFGSWFSVRFCSRGADNSLDPKGIILNTSPAHKETHWKQVIFLFDNAPYVEVGTIIEGVMTIERNKYWRRHFEVVLKFQIDGNSQSWQKRFPVWR